MTAVSGQRFDVVVTDAPLVEPDKAQHKNPQSKTGHGYPGIPTVLCGPGSIEQARKLHVADSPQSSYGF